jgi:hypothetical protein
MIPSGIPRGNYRGLGKWAGKELSGRSQQLSEQLSAMRKDDTEQH